MTDHMITGMIVYESGGAHDGSHDHWMIVYKRSHDHLEEHMMDHMITGMIVYKRSHDHLKEHKMVT